MLGKLIKYDLKSMLRTMFPLWIALFVASVLFGIRVAFLNAGSDPAYFNDTDNTVAVLMFLILFAVFTAVFVLNIIVIIQRFWHGLLKDEGYLMFTLPVSVRELVLSKAFSSLIITLLSLVVAALCIFLITAVGIISNHLGNPEYFWYIDLWHELTQALAKAVGEHPLRFTGWVIYWIVAGLTGLLGDIYHAYAAMAIGQLSNKNRFIASIIAYLAISIVLSAAVALPIANLGQSGGYGGFHWFVSSSGGLTTMSLAISLAVSILQLVAFHIVTEFILRKNLNLE